MREITITMNSIVQQLYEAGKLDSLKELFESMGPDDTAALLPALPEELRMPVFRTLPRDLAADVFADMESDDREKLIRAFSPEELRQIITAAFDSLVDDATQDMEIMAAITPSPEKYIETPVWKIWWHRIPWLLLLMISATFTRLIITHFENALAACIVLTGYIPMLMDTGGNCGSQASVTVIRSLSLGELEFKDILKVMWIESRVAVMCGATLAVVNFLKLMFLDQVGVTVAMVISVTLLFTILVAKLVGCSLPMLAKKIGVDPAVCASPFITTAVDALSLLIYFRVAATLLGI